MIKIRLWTDTEMDALKAADTLLSVREFEKIFGGKYTRVQIKEKLAQLGLRPNY